MNKPTTSAVQHPRAAEWGVTPGVAEVTNSMVYTLMERKDGKTMNRFWAWCDTQSETGCDDEELHANATVMADALNTMNAVGKLPSELAAENAALRDAVRELRDVMQNVLADIYAYGWSRHCDDIRNALAKTENLT
jgi:hypothetical protein